MLNPLWLRRKKFKQVRAQRLIWKASFVIRSAMLVNWGQKDKRLR